MKYVLYIAKLYSLSIFQPIVKALKETNNDYRFYVSDNVRNNWNNDWDKNLILEDIPAAKKYNSDAVLCPGNFVDWRIPGIKVQIFHGLGVEKAAHFKIRHFFDVYATSGPYVTERFKKLQSDNNNYFDIIETGWPKVDQIINYDMNGLREKYNIPENKKVILYAPTFSHKMESATKTLSSMADLANDDEVWLLKFHALMNKDIINDFRKLGNDNIRVMNEKDITPLLHISDIMISDTSSVIYEFMILNKPVITIDTIDLKDKGLNINDVHELRSAINKLKENPILLQDKIDKYVNLINPYTDGKVCYNLIKEVNKLVDSGHLPKSNKPLNLFRKWQIIYHSIFRKGYLR